MKLSVDEAMKKFNLPDLCHALANFLTRLNADDSFIIGGRRMVDVDTPLPFDELQIWTKIQLQNRAYHAPYNILPPQTVNASPPSGSWTFGRSDVVLININPSKVWPQSGIEGLFPNVSSVEYAVILLQDIKLPSYVWFFVWSPRDELPVIPVRICYSSMRSISILCHSLILNLRIRKECTWSPQQRCTA
jgi:hypothetical protein